MLAHVQRLATVDETVASTVLIDLSSLLEQAPSINAFWRTVEKVEQACLHGDRHPVLVLTPTRTGSSPARRIAQVSPSSSPGAALRSFFTALRRWKGSVVVSNTERIASLAYNAVPPAGEVTLVTVDVAELDLWCLSTKPGHDEPPVRSILDLQDGSLQSPETIGLPPETLLSAEAILRLATRNYKHQYRQRLAEQLAAGLPVPGPSHVYRAALSTRGGPTPADALPTWLTSPWETPGSRWASEHDFLGAVLEEERLLQGKGTSVAVRQALARQVPPRPGASSTGYVCAVVERGVNSFDLVRLVCRVGGRWRRSLAAGAPELLSDLLTHHPRRWFGPRIADLLAWMRIHGLPLPERGGDPAWSMFVLDPDGAKKGRVDVSRLGARALALPGPSRAWVGDLRRVSPPPVDRELEQVGRALPVLDRAVDELAGMTGQVALLREDIEATLPVIGAIEARGVALHEPESGTWDDFSVALDRALDETAQEACRVLGANVDFFSDATLTVRAIEKEVGNLTDSEKKMPLNDLLRRYLLVFPALEPVVRARALGAFNRERPLHEAARQRATSVHPVTSPQVSGRLGLARPRLQSLPSDSPEGLVLRSALRARPGRILIACDYNAFEARLAAELSGDPVLLQASKAKDLFAELARRLFQNWVPPIDSRALAKLGFYSILYGQTLDQFWKAQHGLAPADAAHVYQAATSNLQVLLKYRDQVHADIDRQGGIVTRGGWRRFPTAMSKGKRHREGFSTVIQGLAADIYRRLLRRLEVDLAPLDAGVVHILHDEVFVDGPAVKADTMARMVASAMSEVASEATPLVTNVDLFVKEPRAGGTWADL